MILPFPLAYGFAASTTASANAGGVRSPGGVFTQSRVVATARASTCASSKAAIVSLRRAAGLSTTTSPGAVRVAAFLYAVNV